MVRGDNEIAKEIECSSGETRCKGLGEESLYKWQKGKYFWKEFENRMACLNQKLWYRFFTEGETKVQQNGRDHWLWKSSLQILVLANCHSYNI